MTKRTVVLLALLLASRNVFAAGAHLHSINWNSGIFQCKPKDHSKIGELKWINPGPQTVYVKAIEAWSSGDWNTGVNPKDMWAHFGSHSGNNPFGDIGYDYYANPSGPVSVYRNFSPDFIPIPPGHDLTMEWGCSDSFPGKVPTLAQWIYRVFYTYEVERIVPR